MTYIISLSDVDFISFNAKYMTQLLKILWTTNLFYFKFLVQHKDIFFFLISRRSKIQLEIKLVIFLLLLEINKTPCIPILCCVFVKIHFLSTLWSLPMFTFIKQLFIFWNRNNKHCENICMCAFRGRHNKTYVACFFFNSNFYKYLYMSRKSRRLQMCTPSPSGKP